MCEIARVACCNQHATDKVRCMTGLVFSAFLAQDVRAAGCLPVCAIATVVVICDDHS